MSGKFVYIVGLKAFCSECRNGFSASRQQQECWFNDEPVACPTCKKLQQLPREQLELLDDKSNPGLFYAILITLVSLFGIGFWWQILKGAYFPLQEIVAMVFGLPAALLALNWMMRSATGDLRVQLTPHDSP